MYNYVLCIPSKDEGDLEITEKGRYMNDNCQILLLSRENNNNAINMKV